MTATWRDLAVGASTIVAVAALATLLLLFGEFGEGNSYPVTIFAQDAVGIRTGSKIELNGVRIGRVTAVTVDAASELPVKIEATIDAGVRIPAAPIVYAKASVFGGSSTLFFEIPPESIALPTLPADGSAVIDATIGSWMFTQVTQELDARLMPMIEGFDALTRTWTTVGDQIDSLMGSPLGPLTSVTIRNSLRRLDQTLDAAHVWLSDESLRAEVTRAVTRTNEVLDQLDETLAQTQTLATGLHTDSRQLMMQLADVAGELSLVLESASRVAAAIDAGSGTVGQAVHNPDLYNSLVDAIVELRRAAQETQLLMQRVAEEGVIPLLSPP